MKQPDGLYPVICTEHSFYRAYIEFMTPFHKLTPREKDVAARIIAQYYRMKESGIKDPEVLRDLLWSQSSRKDIRESEKMSPAQFQLILAALKKAGIIVDGNLNMKYVPQKNGDSPRFVMCVVFDWSSPEKLNSYEKK